MTLTTGTVSTWNGKRGIILDTYGNYLRFSAIDVQDDDLRGIREGVSVVIALDSFPMIELASGSFTRYVKASNELVEADTEWKYVG
jgi:hypothetical protein